MKKYFIVSILISVLLSISCRSNDDFTIIDEPEEEVVLAEEVELFELEGIENSLVLAVVNAGKSSYLVNKKGEILKSWDFDIGLGNDLELLPSGKLLGIFKASNLSFFFWWFWRYS